MTNNFFEDIKSGQKLFGEDIQNLINFLMLTVVYFLGVGATSIVAKLFGKHFLDMKMKKNSQTYWEDYGNCDKKKEEYLRQF